MIKVARSTIETPAIFHSEEMRETKRAAKLYFSLSLEQRQQRHFDWKGQSALLWKGGCMTELLKLFQGKCAYCESLVSSNQSPNIEFFRPRDSALGLDGSFANDHYWWLAFEWANCLLACDLCYSVKASRFPVMKARVKPRTVGVKLDGEAPLLLDPCRDDPETHLVFAKNGRVVSVTAQGQCTIEVLALNREPLVSERKRHLAELDSLIDALVSGVRLKHQLLYDLLDASAPFLAAKRQLVRTRAAELRAIMSDRNWFALHVRGISKKPAMSEGRVAKAKKVFERALKSKVRHSVEDDGKAARRAYFSGKRRIERIEISNFKKIRQLDLSVSPSGTERESWLMLLGENATGKSSLLQAVGLSLLGGAHLERLGLDARDFLTRGQQSGFVKISLTNVLEPVELHFQATSREFRVRPSRELVLLLGYGATRLLSRSAKKDYKPERYVRVKNLFDPYARLQHAERWLTDEERLSDASFAQAALALKKLLMLQDQDKVTRNGSKVLVQINDALFSLRQLSDGYQSMIALAADIMMGLITKWERMELAEGVVLIDEIENHLHPIWKMEIVSRFRSVFPMLQFVVTTHDPLCLRGLSKEEVVIFKKGTDGLIIEKAREDISRLRADQLLTSPLFGLISTRDPRIQAETNQFSALLGKDDRSEAETTQMLELGKNLESSLLVGETTTEREKEGKVRRAAREVAEELSVRIASSPENIAKKRTARKKLHAIFRPL